MTAKQQSFTQIPRQWRQTAITFILLFFVLLVLLIMKTPVQAAPVITGQSSVNSQSDFTCTDVTEIPQTECDALVAFYHSTNGPNWSTNTGWLTTNTPCNWYGVTCEVGHVTQLNLSSNQLTNVLPPALGNLTNLQLFHAADNDLSGEIPAELGTMQNLNYLDLERNQFSGSIPPALGNLTQLEYLNLARNQLAGSIPSTFGNLVNLRIGLDLSANHLSGSIPPELGRLPNLEVLILEGNQLNGVIPSELMNITSLRLLPLSYNALTATDPALITWLDQVALDWRVYWQASQTVAPQNIVATMQNDGQMDLIWNPISYTADGGYYEISYATQANGPFTVHGTSTDKTSNSYTISDLSPNTTYFVRMRTFTPAHERNGNDVWSDYSEIVNTQSTQPFSCANVTEIPHSECEALVALYNSTNGPGWTENSSWLMTNSPCSWYGITCEDSHVTKVQLQNNQLTGSIPPQLGDLDALFTLYLFDNALTGEIPPQLGSLTGLDELILFGNALSGPIPPSLGNLTQVRYLLLDGNELTGEIPPELGQLSNVIGLYLHQNHLTGPIPAELGNLESAMTLLLFENQLSGPIPAELGNLHNVQWLHLNGNQLRGLIPTELIQLSKIGPGALVLVHNALTATDPALLTWLDQVAPNWQATQTVPPTDLAVSELVDGQATLTWTPILYTVNSGYYEISYATESGGPYTVHGTTADKTGSAYSITGLTSDNTYYIRIRTFTPAHSQNQSDLWSDYSEVVEIQGSTTATNLLQNGNFETGTEPWIFYTNGEGTFTTAGPAYEGDAAARVEIIETGSNMQLYQTGFTLEPRTHYRLSIAAYSSSGHDLSLYVHQHKSPYTYYGLRNFRLNLTTGWQTFSLEFKTKNFTMPTDDTRLRLWFKPFATGGDLYWIDNIVLEKIDARTATASTNSEIVDAIAGTVQLPAAHTESVTLTLVDLETAGQAFTRSTTTAADGTFQFTDLPAGTYELQATPPQGLLTPEPYQFEISEREHEDFVFVMEAAISTLYLPLIAR